jgi:hypothetical protein
MASLDELDSHSFGGGGIHMSVIDNSTPQQIPPQQVERKAPQLNVPPNVQVPNEVLQFLQPQDTKKPAPSETNPKLDTGYKPIDIKEVSSSVYSPDIIQPKQPQINQQEAEQFTQQLNKMNGGNLPQRDIPIQTQNYHIDPNVQTDYIPRQNMIDYMPSSLPDKRKPDPMETFYQQLQLPILAALLFFFFQLPWLNKLLFEYFPSLFTDEGTATIYVFFIKTSIFVGLFSVIHNILQT